MVIGTSEGDLETIEIAKIDRNPENPRLFFRPKELEELTESIRRHGVQVPISVYKERGRYVLLDGERRWRCSLKLNKKKIPAIIRSKPDAFTNLVLMFNIHALREQWDLLTIALKLPRVISLYEEKHGVAPNERELGEETGLSRSVIRRCRLLINLPEHHVDRIKAELNKPKGAQRITEDFYIEMERALNTVVRVMPALFERGMTREDARRVLMSKYDDGIVRNIVDFRKIARIARAEKVDADVGQAQNELERLFDESTYSIEAAYEGSVAAAYSERTILNHIRSAIEGLQDLDPEELDEQVVLLLRQLVGIARVILEGRR